MLESSELLIQYWSSAEMPMNREMYKAESTEIEKDHCVLIPFITVQMRCLNN